MHSYNITILQSLIDVRLFSYIDDIFNIVQFI